MNPIWSSKRWRGFGSEFLFSVLSWALGWAAILFTIWLLKPEIIHRHMTLLTVVVPSSLLLRSVVDALGRLARKPDPDITSPGADRDQR